MSIKILYVADFLFAGGAETVLRRNVQLFKQNPNFEIEVYCASENYMRSNDPFSYLYNFRHSRNLKTTILTFQPDIIHIHSFYHLLSPSVLLILKRLKPFKNFKIVYTAHDYYLLHPSTSLLKYDPKGKATILNKFNLFSIVFSRIDSRSLVYDVMKKIQWIISVKILNVIDLIDVMISPSNFLKELFIKSGLTKVRVIRNPADLHTPKSEELPDTKSLRMVFFGRLSVEKGLIEFIHQFRSEFVHFTLDVFGEGPERAKLHEIVAQLDLTEQVFFHGYVEHSKMLNELAKFNIMVLPSIWYENAPMSLVEAAQSNMVILGRDLGGVAEISKLCSNYVLFQDKSNPSEVICELRESLADFKRPDLTCFSEQVFREQTEQAYLE